MKLLLLVQAIAVMAANEATIIPRTDPNDPSDQLTASAAAGGNQPPAGVGAGSGTGQPVELEPPRYNLTQFSIDEVLDLAYTPEFRPTDCRPILGNILYSCNEDEPPLFKLSSFQVSPYPMRPGFNDLLVVSKLMSAIEKGATLELISFNGRKLLFSGTVDLCYYMGLVGFQCKLASWKSFRQERHLLEVPDDVPSGVYSFVAAAWGKRGEYYGRIAGSIEIQTDIPPEDGEDELLDAETEGGEGAEGQAGESGHDEL